MNTLDIEAVKAWFTRLYGDMDGTEFVNIVRTDDWTGEFVSCWDTDGITDTVTRFDADEPIGIYHRVTTVADIPATGRGDATISHVLPGFWADIDIAGPGHKSKGALPTDVAAARRIVANSALPEPTLWVHSGGGLYPWWLLTEPTEITPANIAEITKLSEDLQEELQRSARELGMEYAPVGDLARVLRVPGTINRKEGLTRKCQVIEDDGTRFTVEQIRAVVPVGAKRLVTNGVRGGHPDGVWESLPEGSMCGAIRRKLDKAVTALRGAENGSRHRTALSGIGSLVTVGNFGHHGARDALAELEAVFNEVKPADEQGADEWTGLVEHCLSKTEISDDRHCCGEITFSDAHMAQRAAREVMHDRFRWSSGMGWVRWDGHVWSRCDDADVIEAVRLWAVDNYRLAAVTFSMDPTQTNDDVVKGWRSMLGRSKVESAVKLARGIKGIVFDATEMDADPDILNCRNGVVDLRTGELMESDPTRLVSKITGCDYDPNAAHPDFDAAMTAVRDEIRGWLQTRIGQSATGYYTPDDLFVLLFGGGANGKSTLLNGVEMALGSYHVIVDDKILLGSAQRDESMDLLGARAAWLEELPEGAHLDVIKLKKIVGTKKVKGHHLYKSSITWDASHSLFATSNYRPIVDETDDGTWRRLVLVTFPYKFVSKPEGEPYAAHERPGDPKLRGRVERDPAVHRAFLRWIVEGARKWYADDMAIPELPKVIEEDTNEWRREVDLVMAFWDDQLEPCADSAVSSDDLLMTFNEWVTRQQHKPWSMKTFAARFGGHDATKRARVIKRRAFARSVQLSRSPNATTFVDDGKITLWDGVKLKIDNDELFQ